MIFDTELLLLKDKIENAEDMDELNYLRTVNEKKYWWTSIFVAGLFYALNGKVGKMIVTWILSFITLGIYALYVIYTSYKDQNEFNNQMEYYILKRSKELKGKTNKSPSDNSNDEVITFNCPNCGDEVNSSTKFCPNCGDEVTPPEPVFCSKCGEKVSTDTKFCPSCGNTINKLISDETE